VNTKWLKKHDRHREFKKKEIISDASSWGGQECIREYSSPISQGRKVKEEFR